MFKKNRWQSLFTKFQLYDFMVFVYISKGLGPTEIVKLKILVWEYEFCQIMHLGRAAQYLNEALQYQLRTFIGFNNVSQRLGPTGIVKLIIFAFEFEVVV